VERGTEYTILSVVRLKPAWRQESVGAIASFDLAPNGLGSTSLWKHPSVWTFMSV
jgi:hypothetical protein